MQARGGHHSAFAVGGLAIDSPRVRTRAILAVGSPLALVLFGLWVSSLVGNAPPRQVAAGATAGLSRLRSLPMQDQAVISVGVGADQAAFAAKRSGTGYLLAGGGVSAGLGRDGLLFRAQGGWLSMGRASVGGVSRSRAPAGVSIAAHANRVAYARAGLREWYAAGPLGIEQGFTVMRRPRMTDGSLMLTLALGGPLQARRVGSQIVFFTPRGRVALRYGGLSAVDARGRPLPATLALRGSSLLLRIADRGAHYPLRIDPFIQQGPKLTAGEEIGKGIFGSSGALSADGNTALIAGQWDNANTGAVWVFTRSAGTWTQQGPKLTASGEIGKGLLGVSVALSADGNTALAGGPSDSGKVGAAWVFTRSGSTWTQQAELTAKSPEEIGAGEFGESVALSADGNTALVGAYGDNGFTGAGWVFTRVGASWSQQGGKLTPGGGAGASELGIGAALSADGNTALLGGTGDNTSKGAAWVFTRSAGAWTQQGAKLTASDETGNAELGYSVALSGDGYTALVSGPQERGGVGAAWVFTRTAGSWSQQGPKLEANDAMGSPRFGLKVALSSDGNLTLVGGPHDSTGIGAAWVFARSGSTWTQQGTKLTGVGEEGSALLGTSVALSADGATALSGGIEDNGQLGAAWVFADSPSPVTGAASGVTSAGATVNGTVGPGASSTAYFQYGTTIAYGASTAGQGFPASGSTSLVAAGIGGLAPATTYHFRIVAENSGGVSFGGDQTFTTAPLGTTTTLPSPTPPIVGNATQSHARWREGSRLAQISRGRKPPVGTSFSFTLNESANVSLAFTQQVSGRKVKGKCVTQTKKNRHKPTCKRTVTQGTLSFAAHTGTDKVSFQGRISASKKLKLGRYTLVITATTAVGQRSSPKQLSFTIVK